MQAKLKITVDRSAERILANRSDRLTPRDAPMQLTPYERSIHFLRGVHSRAAIALPAFYLFLGASAESKEPYPIEGYPGVVFKHVIEHSSISTVSLSCRKIFDHRAGLTGASFAKSPDVVVAKVAEHWATKSSRPLEDAMAALEFLRSIFRECAKADSTLLKESTALSRRIGLLKQYANRSAAHLSLEDYEFSLLDCAHLVAAMTVIGEIIRSFDDPMSQSDYFDEIDNAGLRAAIHLFPGMPNLRLFRSISIETQSRLCWEWGSDRGRHMLLEELPYAIGWF
ncbi:MAG: hypothetical protein KJ025_15745 [Burkholderiales bacterium]|nr:hypothetical protein [Burkholderiales bacterium]